MGADWFWMSIGGWDWLMRLVNWEAFFSLCVGCVRFCLPLTDFDILSIYYLSSKLFADH